MSRIAAAPLARRPIPAAGFRDMMRTAALWLQIRRERRALDTLDARMLRDIGLDREAAEAEARRPCWRTDARF
ncbi:MAG: DUF1127 domain-containing protein [Pseudomonadota bacterium]